EALGLQLRAVALAPRTDERLLGLEHVDFAAFACTFDGVELLGEALVPGPGRGEVLVELPQDLLELPDLAFLLQQRRVERRGRAADDDAARLDAIAVEGHERRFDAPLFPELERPSQGIDDDDVAEQRVAEWAEIGRDFDEIAEPPEHPRLLEQVARAIVVFIRVVRLHRRLREVEHLERRTHAGGLLAALGRRPPEHLAFRQGDVHVFTGFRPRATRHERRPPLLLALEELDATRPDGRSIDHHAFQTVPERRAESRFEQLRRLQIVREHAVDGPRRRRGRRAAVARDDGRELVLALHHHLHAAVTAAVAALDLLQRLQARAMAVHLRTLGIEGDLGRGHLLPQGAALAVELAALAPERLEPRGRGFDLRRSRRRGREGLGGLPLERAALAAEDLEPRLPVA